MSAACLQLQCPQFVFISQASTQFFSGQAAILIQVEGSEGLKQRCTKLHQAAKLRTFTFVLFCSVAWLKRLHKNRNTWYKRTHLRNHSLFIDVHVQHRNLPRAVHVRYFLIVFWIWFSTATPSKGNGTGVSAPRWCASIGQRPFVWPPSVPALSQCGMPQTHQRFMYSIIYYV